MAMGVLVKNCERSGVIHPSGDILQYLRACMAVYNWGEGYIWHENAGEHPKMHKIVSTPTHDKNIPAPRCQECWGWEIPL